MTPVEIIALVLAIVGILKVIAMLTNPSIWLHSVGKLWKNSVAFLVVAIILCVVVLKYLLTELTIVQIFAVFGFAAPFYWIALAPYRKQIYEMVSHDITPGTVVRKHWFTLLIWAILTIWVLKELFA